MMFLKYVAYAWTDLPKSICVAILEMVRAAKE